jgi:hypothetical protein
MTPKADFLKNWMEQKVVPAEPPKSRAERRNDAKYDANPVPPAPPKPPETPKITDPHVHSGDIITIPGFRGDFVVEFTAMTGGDGKEWPDAWHVLARRLNKDRSYNAGGKVVKFTQNTRHFTTCISGVSVVGRMQRFVR